MEIVNLYKKSYIKARKNDMNLKKNKWFAIIYNMIKKIGTIKKVIA